MKAIGLLLAVLTVLAAGSGLTLALWRRSAPILAAELFAWSWLLGAGLVSALLALGGIVLVSREPGKVGGGVAAGVGLALVAALGFGLFVVGLGEAAQESASWATASASLNAFAGQTVRILIEAADAATASLVEAAVDDLRITQQ